MPCGVCPKEYALRGIPCGVAMPCGISPAEYALRGMPLRGMPLRGVPCGVCPAGHALRGMPCRVCPAGCALRGMPLRGLPVLLPPRFPRAPLAAPRFANNFDLAFAPKCRVRSLGSVAVAARCCRV